MMDSDKWLEFTVYSGIDKYKTKISKLLDNSKKFKSNFDYMRLIAVVYYAMEDLIDQIEEFV